MDFFIPFLALWEITIGIGLIIGYGMRATILLLLLQMVGTLAPLILTPQLVWTVFPFGLTLEGQYIIKNVVLMSAAVAIGSAVRASETFDIWQAPHDRAV